MGRQSLAGLTTRTLVCAERPHQEKGPPMFRQTLVAFDGSPRARRALDDDAERPRHAEADTRVQA